MTEKKKEETAEAVKKILVEKLGVDSPIWEEAKTEYTMRKEIQELKDEIELLKAERIYFRGLYDGARGKEPREIKAGKREDLLKDMAEKFGITKNGW